jgi:hypothetical protein
MRIDYRQPRGRATSSPPAPDARVKARQKPERRPWLDRAKISAIAESPEPAYFTDRTKGDEDYDLSD